MKRNAHVTLMYLLSSIRCRRRAKRTRERMLYSVLMMLGPKAGTQDMLQTQLKECCQGHVCQDQMAQTPFPDSSPIMCMWAQPGGVATATRNRNWVAMVQVFGKYEFQILSDNPQKQGLWKVVRSDGVVGLVPQWHSQLSKEDKEHHASSLSAISWCGHKSLPAKCTKLLEFSNSKTNTFAFIANYPAWGQ